MSEDLEQKEIEHLLENREYGYEPSDVERIPLSDIKPDLMNANRHTERGTYQLKNSIEKFGFAEAGTLDANNKIIAGNNRTEVAVDVLDPESVRVIEHDGKTPIYIKLPHVDLETVEGRELAIALNRTAQTGIELDPDMLRQLDDMGVELGDWFTDLELDDMGIDIDEPEPAEDAGADVDRAAELQEQWQTETGQLWVLPSRDGKGEHRLLIGDCTVKENVERLMGRERADISITDPPYNVGVDYGNSTNDNQKRNDFVLWCKKWLTHCPAKLLMTVGIKRLLWWGEISGDPQWIISWVKRNGQGQTGLGGTNKWDAILVYGVKPDNNIDIIEVSNNYSDGIKSSGSHPTAKPVELWDKLLSRFANKGDLVYEPFMGSGTTMISSENNGMICFGTEISPSFTAVILNRYAQTFGVSPYLSS